MTAQNIDTCETRQFRLREFSSGGPETNKYEDGVVGQMICDWMTCLECIKCAYFFRLFLSSDFLLGIFSIFHKNVGNSVLPINFQRIVERLFIAGIKSCLKCLPVQ